MKYGAKSVEKEPKEGVSPESPRRIRAETAEPERAAKHGNWFFRLTAPLFAGYDANPVEKGPKDNVSPENPRRIRAETAEPERPAKHRGRFSRWAAPLLVVFGIGCGSVVASDDDFDAQPEVGDDAEAQTDNVDDNADVREDAVEDAAPEEGIGPDEGTEATDDADASETPGEDGDARPEAEEDGSLEEGDSRDCTRTTREEPATHTGPGLVCGSSQTIRETWEIVTWEGADCEFVEEERKMLIYEIILSPYLNADNLGCMDGAMLGLLNGDEVVLASSPAALQTAIKIIDERLNLTDNRTIEAGPSEYSGYLSTIRADNIILDVTAPGGTSPTPHLVNNTGYMPVLGSGIRGYAERNINIMAMTVQVYYIEIPVHDFAPGDTVINTRDSRRPSYSFYIDSVGSEYRGVGYSLIPE